MQETYKNINYTKGFDIISFIKKYDKHPLFNKLPVDKHRKKVCINFLIVFDKYYTEENNKQYFLLKTSINLEKYIYNFSLIKTRHLGYNWEEKTVKSNYVTKALHLYRNMNPEHSQVKNNYLIYKVLSKQINLEHLVFNAYKEEIFPEFWTKNNEIIIEEFNKRNINKVGFVEDIPDGILKCGKCRSMKTTYYALQCKSGDEPMSNFCRCTNCGHQWVFS